MSAPRLPAEWEPQSGIMLTWPHDRSDWAPLLTRVEPVFVHIACEISQREEVLIVCRDEALRQHVLHQLREADARLDHINCRIAPSNDSWARDHGPITVLDDNSSSHLLDFTFNGWGGKYPAELDNAITRNLAQQGVFGDTPCRHIDQVLEGGSIDSDGRGRLLTTEACLLSAGRNPQLDKAGIEQALRKYLGTKHILWLKHGALAGDDTDSHIDTLARFCDPHTIAYTSCDDPADSQYTELQAMQAELSAFRDPDGRPYRLLPLPLPAAQFNAKGERLPATYANFLIINGAVLVPTYGDPLDCVALKQLQTGFPQRDIIAIDARPLIEQFGSLHCVTMQLPAGVLAGSDYP
ncbi:MAG TPA: agmatine deiminase family protein [Chromatiales bacterium]|nr:agmatine deiminase family protein [Chromatiales bacterium]HEX22034.1 agmatine deiminase family protein [Chromatiales bacterium]